PMLVKPIVLSVAAFVLFLIIHGGHFHWFKPAQRARAVFAVFVLGIIGYSASFVLITEQGILSPFGVDPGYLTSVPGWFSLVGFLAGALFYTLLFIGYLEFYFTADRSLTIRILSELINSGAGDLSPSEIKERCEVDAYYLRRLDDLTYGRYLSERHG